MSSEWLTGLGATGRLLMVVLFATVYWMGGRHDKWIRRYLGGGSFGVSVCVLAATIGRFSPWMLLGIVAYPLALSQGYGGDTLRQKLLRRARYGLGLGLSALPFAWPTGAWTLLGLQLALCLAVSIALGLLNPVDAAEEEALIAVQSVVFVPFMV